ncbi:MAG TPA: hypothetical protein VGW33_01875 [Terriglobia bacterium]|nr:hypothetical protein [Terriglobia bacterium]
MPTENKLTGLVVVAATVFVAVETGGDVWAIAVFAACGALFVIECSLLRRTLSLNSLTLPALFIYIYLVTTAISSIPVFAVLQHPMRRTYFLAVQSVLVTFPLGVGIANRLYKNPARIVQGYVHSDVQRTISDFKFVPLFVVMALALGPLLVPYFVYAKHIQLIEVLKAYPTTVNRLSLRFAESDVPKVAQYGFEIARRFVLPLCALYAYFMARLYRGKWTFVFWLTFCVTLLVSLLTLDRAEPVGFLMMMVFAYLLARKQTVSQAFRSPKILLLFGFTFALAGLISVAQYQSTFSEEGVVAAIWRVLSVRIGSDPATMTWWAFRIFHSPSLFLHFKYERIFSVLPGFQYVEWNDTRYFVTPPLACVGNLWENWGWPAVLIGPIALGFVYQVIQLSVFVRKSVPILALQVILLADVAWAVYGKVLSVMSVSVLLACFIVALAFRPRRRTVAAARLQFSPRPYPGEADRSVVPS